MDHFAHFFEFCAAVNSAYIASTSFVEKITFIVGTNKADGRRTNHSLENSAFGLRQILDEAQEKLQRLATSAKVNIKARVDELNSIYTELASEIDNIVPNHESELRYKTDNPDFHMRCLAGATYAVIMLVLFGFEVDFHQPTALSYLFCFNVSIILLNLFYLIFEKVFKRKPFSLLKIILFSCLITLVFIIGDWFFYYTYCNYNYYYFNVVISLSMPSMHILVYTYKSWTTYNKLTAKAHREISDLQIKCVQYSHDVDATSKTIDGLDISD